VKRPALLTALTVAITAALVSLAPSAADAAPRTVYVDGAVNSAWPVASAMSFVDTYTGSHMVRGHCHTGYKCIVIRENWSINRSWGAVTYPGNPTTTMQLNPRRRTTSYTQRLHILAHELGHANGIYSHNPHCTSIMYYNVQCPGGRYAPLSFTSAEKAILRAN
jgi:hypothetical protein